MIIDLLLMFSAFFHSCSSTLEKVTPHTIPVSYFQYPLFLKVSYISFKPWFCSMNPALVRTIQNSSFSGCASKMLHCFSLWVHFPQSTFAPKGSAMWGNPFDEFSGMIVAIFFPMKDF